MANFYQKPSYLKKKGRSSDIFLLIVEGSNTERFYFDKLKTIRGRNSNIRIKTESSDGGDIEKMLKIARQKIKESKNRNDIRNAPLKKVYLIIDRDRFANGKYQGIGLQHLRKGLNDIISEEAIEIVISAPSFEYWYLLHFCDKKPANYDKVISMLERFLKNNKIINERQSYSKNEEDTNKMLDKFLAITDISKAIENAEKISTRYNMDADDRLNRDPYTEVHYLIKELELDKYYE